MLARVRSLRGAGLNGAHAARALLRAREHGAPEFSVEIHGSIVPRSVGHGEEPEHAVADAAESHEC